VGASEWNQARGWRRPLPGAGLVTYACELITRKA
jgi:hypothetical protein